MSETATFCATCGAHVLPASIPEPEALPDANAGVSDAADWAAERRVTDWDAPDSDAPDSDSADSAPVDDQSALTPQVPVAAPAPKTTAISLKSARILIALGVLVALLIVGVLVGSTVRHSISHPFLTLADYNSLTVGLDLQQVEAILSAGSAATQTKDVTSATGGDTYRWTNPDGSYLAVVFVNGRVTSMSQSGLTTSASGRTSSVRTTLFAFASLMYFLVTFVAAAGSLYVASLWRGYSLTIKQVIAIGAACALARLVPWVGGLASIVVFWALIQWFTAADFVEILILVFVSYIVEIVLALPLGLGFGLGSHL